jgi:hypothetical protein
MKTEPCWYCDVPCTPFWQVVDTVSALPRAFCSTRCLAAWAHAMLHPELPTVLPPFGLGV